MTLIMKTDVAFNPVDVGGFGLMAVVVAAHDESELIKEFRH